MPNLKKNKQVCSAVVMVIATLLASVASIQAYDAIGEADIVERLSQSASFSVETSKDPFRQLIQKPKFVPQQPKTPVKANLPAKQAPVVKPLELSLTGIVGNDNHRLAIVLINNQELVLNKDQQFNQEFKVIDIHSDRLVVYSNRERARKTFRLASN